MRSDYPEPLNLGQDRMVTINELADMVADRGRLAIVRSTTLTVRRACAAATRTTRLRAVLGWEPQIPWKRASPHLRWIEEQIGSTKPEISVTAAVRTVELS